MKRIGIECESIEEDVWGLSRIVTKLLEEISKRPQLALTHRFVLYFKWKIPELPFLNSPVFEKKIVRLPFQPLPSFSLYYYFLLPIKLWFEKIDLMVFPNYMLPHLFFGKSLVHLTNDVFYEMRSPHQKLRYKLAYKVFSTWAADHATHIFTLSEFARRELIALLNIAPQSITANHLGIDIGNKLSPPPARQSHLLYLGQALPRRHARETILAFEKIASEYPNLRLYVIGYDKYIPAVIDKLKESVNKRLGREAVIHKNRVSGSEVEALYAKALLTIYVSEKEAFGLPPLEALALGSVPVVADNDLSHELLGDNAFFVDKMHDEDSIAQAMARGLTDEAKRATIKRNASSLVQKFTWASFTDRFITLCDSLTK